MSLTEEIYKGLQLEELGNAPSEKPTATSLIAGELLDLYDALLNGSVDIADVKINISVKNSHGVERRIKCKGENRCFLKRKRN